MSMDSIIARCHREYHNGLLGGFTFALSKECSPNGCMSWTYEHSTCHCGKTQIIYDKKNINYEYKGDVHIDDKYPMYRISFCFF